MENYYYNKIAKDYHLKRLKPWKPLEEFLRYLNNKGYSFKGNCIDLGCANGRNFKILKNSYNKVIGVDNSIEFLKIARKNLKNPDEWKKGESGNIDLILGDISFLPVRDDTTQNFFSIASIHHIKNSSRRKDAILQLSKLLNQNSFLLITVWRKWQKKYKKLFYRIRLKRLFNPFYLRREKKVGVGEFGDIYIPWTVSSDGLTVIRFYHLFSKREIKMLMKKDFSIKEFHIIGGASNKDNFFILAQKI